MVVLIRCRVCNRKLTNEKSVARQVGAKCYRKWLKGYRGIQLGSSNNVRELADRLVKEGKSEVTLC